MQLRLLDSTTAVADARYRRSETFRRLAGEQPAIGDANQMRFWRPLPPKVIDVICGEGVALEVPLHTHEALQVLLPASRFAVLDGRGRSTFASPERIHLTSPLELHAARSLDGAPFGMRLMLVAPAVLSELREEPSGRRCQAASSFAPRVVDDPGLRAELWTLFDDLRRPLVSLEQAARLRACLSRLLTRHGEHAAMGAGRAAPRGDGVERAREHLRAHTTEHVTLDELAGVAGLSKFYLLRAFRRAHGLTPHAYQMQLRLARARGLIAEGRPLSYVTYDAGFADQSHLTRRFAAFFGLTPARYARQLASPVGPAPRGASIFGRAATPPPAA